MMFDLIFGLPSDGPDVELTIIDSLGTILFGPALETLLMVAILMFITKFTERVVFSACLCALFFSFLHSMSYPLWGLFTFIPFVIFGVAFQVWRNNSTKAGFTVAFFIHALNNGYVVLIGMIAK